MFYKLHSKPSRIDSTWLHVSVAKGGCAGCWMGSLDSRKTCVWNQLHRASIVRVLLSPLIGRTETCTYIISIVFWLLCTNASVMDNSFACGLCFETNLTLWTSYAPSGRFAISRIYWIEQPHTYIGRTIQHAYIIVIANTRWIVHGNS